jgi:predicted DCC family thiol-disulfide oxidoreductase YuxK
MNKFPYNLPADKKVILFDGVCNFCNFWVNYIIEKDKKDLFRFASLQSEFGQSILSKLNLAENDFDTFVLIESKKVFIRSTAALKVVKDISGWLKIVYPFIILPVFIRDSVYNVIAKNRYKIFGKSEFCRIPSETEKSKFIE